MKNFIKVGPGEFLYHGKVDSFTYGSKAKNLTMELKAGTETFSYKEEHKPYDFFTILDSCSEDYIPIVGDEELYIHVKEIDFENFEVIKLITEFDLSDNIGLG